MRKFWCVCITFVFCLGAVSSSTAAMDLRFIQDQKIKDEVESRVEIEKSIISEWHARGWHGASKESLSELRVDKEHLLCTLDIVAETVQITAFIVDSRANLLYAAYFDCELLDAPLKVDNCLDAMMDMDKFNKVFSLKQPQYAGFHAEDWAKGIWLHIPAGKKYMRHSQEILANLIEKADYDAEENSQACKCSQDIN